MDFLKKYKMAKTPLFLHLIFTERLKYITKIRYTEKLSCFHGKC